MCSANSHMPEGLIADELAAGSTKRLSVPDGRAVGPFRAKPKCVFADLTGGCGPAAQPPADIQEWTSRRLIGAEPV